MSFTPPQEEDPNVPHKQLLLWRGCFEPEQNVGFTAGHFIRLSLRVTCLAQVVPVNRGHLDSDAVYIVLCRRQGQKFRWRLSLPAPRVEISKYSGVNAY